MCSVLLPSELLRRLISSTNLKKLQTWHCMLSTHCHDTFNDYIRCTSNQEVGWLSIDRQERSHATLYGLVASPFREGTILPATKPCQCALTTLDLVTKTDTDACLTVLTHATHASTTHSPIRTKFSVLKRIVRID